MTDELTKITREDHYEKRWILVGIEGAVDFHISHLISEVPYIGRTGGIEEHRREAPDYRKDAAPDREHCWMIGGKCWHDGSSLYASEVLIPRCDGLTDAEIFDVLRGEYIRRFLSPVE